MPLVYAAGFLVETVAVLVGGYVVCNGGPAIGSVMVMSNIFSFGLVLGMAAGRRSAR